MTPRRREDRLAGELAARLAGCPPADDLQSLREGSLGPEAAARVNEHARRCASCGAALEFLDRAEADPQVAGTPVPDEALRRSDAALAALVGPGARRARAGWNGGLKLAAGVAFAGVLAAGGYLWIGRPADQAPVEDLGDVDLGELRGAGPLELQAPIGRITGTPEEMRWAPHPAAVTYRVILLDSGMDEVWVRDTGDATPRLVLDAPARQALRPGGESSRFTWQVVALGPLGQSLGRSAAAHFEIAAAATER